ncbi:MAG: C4-type zinc ribbon domain-containing protein [Microbacterium sp.]
MKAAPADQLRLLDLADLDARLRQTEHTQRNPPQAARVKELLDSRPALSHELAQRQSAVDDLRGEQDRIEADVRIVQARRDRDAALLQTVSSPKDAAGLEHELASLARRQRELEDGELEVMEQLETAEAAVAAQEARLAEVNAEGARLSAEAKQVVADAAARVEQLTRDRADVVASVPAGLVAQYERNTARGGVGAALLRARTCTGCHMVLSGTDLGVLRQIDADEVAACPECGCILVRTGESGL